MTRLPVVDPLDRIEIATPCRVPWDEMRGDGRVRFCGRCRQNVYNVEALARKEALELIHASQGRVCMRFYRRPDGTVVTADCWTLLRQARRRGWLAFAGVMVVVLWTQIAAQVAGLRTLFLLLRRTPPTAPCLAPALPTPRAPEVIDVPSVPSVGGIQVPFPATPPAPPLRRRARKVMPAAPAPAPTLPAPKKPPAESYDQGLFLYTK